VGGGEQETFKFLSRQIGSLFPFKENRKVIDIKTQLT
jgi:hypothetical protein